MNVDASTAHGSAAQESSGNRENTVGYRLLKIGVWGWRIIAVCIALWLAAITTLILIDVGPRPVILEFLGAYAFGAIILTASSWAVVYVAKGEKKHFASLFWEVVLGRVPLYYWFVLAVLLVGGMGNVLWHDAHGTYRFNDDILRSHDFAEGVGSAIAALMVGAPFWFLVPRKWSHVGHMFGTAIAAAILLYVNFRFELI